MFTVYVIANPKNKRYIKQTNNTADRLKMHNDISLLKAKFHHTTFKNGPWKIIFNKNFKTQTEALKFEKFLKSGKGREWLERARRGG